MSSTAIEAKSQLVTEYSAKFKEVASLVVVNYRGLNVEQVTELRRSLRAEGVQFKVLKNNISRRAVKEAGYEGMDDVFIGPTAVAYSDEDVVAPARVLYNFSKNHSALELKAGLIEGSVATLEQVMELATLPNREGLLSMLLSVLQAPMRNMACVVKAVSEQKEAGVEPVTQEAEATTEPATEEVVAVEAEVTTVAVADEAETTEPATETTEVTE